jgi:hypothetical protein
MLGQLILINVPPQKGSLLTTHPKGTEEFIFLSAYLALSYISSSFLRVAFCNGIRAALAWLSTCFSRAIHVIFAWFFAWFADRRGCEFIRLNEM